MQVISSFIKTLLEHKQTHSDVTPCEKFLHSTVCLGVWIFLRHCAYKSSRCKQNCQSVVKYRKLKSEIGSLGFAALLFLAILWLGFLFLLVNMDTCFAKPSSYQFGECCRNSHISIIPLHTLFIRKGAPSGQTFWQLSGAVWVHHVMFHCCTLRMFVVSQ